MRMASNGQRAARLLSVLQCTGQATTTKNCPDEKVSGAEAEKPSPTVWATAFSTMINCGVIQDALALLDSMFLQ